MLTPGAYERRLPQVRRLPTKDKAMVWLADACHDTAWLPLYRTFTEGVVNHPKVQDEYNLY